MIAVVAGKFQMVREAPVYKRIMVPVFLGVAIGHAIFGFAVHADWLIGGTRRDEAMGPVGSGIMVAGVVALALYGCVLVYRQYRRRAA